MNKQEQTPITDHFETEIPVTEAFVDRFIGDWHHDVEGEFQISLEMKEDNYLQITIDFYHD